MKSYDYLVVGSGLFGATFACMACRQGKKCLVIDKRPHLGGNIYYKRKEGINVHKYGAHIFHTSISRFGTLSIPLWNQLLHQFAGDCRNVRSNCPRNKK